VLRGTRRVEGKEPIVVRSNDLGAGDRSKVKSDINVTSLVGVLFVLLSIMMLSVPIVHLDAGVRLPDAVHTVNKPNPDCGELTVVSIGADRQLYVNCHAIREDELAARVTESLERNKGKAVLLKADEAAPYSAIMAAMDRLRTAQITNVSLVVKTPANLPRPRP
jgi:biopolymer transport protein TolR